MIIEGRTIDDVWRSAMFNCVRYGVDYRVKEGSYVGSLRKQLPYVVLVIEEPWTRPLAVSMPALSNLPVPTTEDKIMQYFGNYLMGDNPNFVYTYGMYIMLQMQKVIDKLNKSEGATNQACITVGEPDSINLDDPPCLRSISFKCIQGRLQMFVYFRSWDLFTGLPENLGGLQLLKEYVLMHLTFSIADGPLVATSDGLHLYDMYFPLVNQLCATKIKE